jgi:hypothetical protein
MIPTRDVSHRRDSPDLLRIVRFVTILSFFLFFLISFLRIPVHNYDFWWHLATGKYIVETKSLPQNDPFSFTMNSDTPSERKRVILKGNWLAESIFYMVYNTWDLKGIIFLRTLMLVCFLFFVFLNIKKHCMSNLTALVVTAGVFLTAKTFSGERPQLFTFFVFSLVFYLMEDFRTRKSNTVFIIPFLILLLANMHPGYIICLVLITLYLAAEGGRRLLGKDDKNGIFYRLLILWGLSVIASLFNPNGAIMLTRIVSAGQGAYIKGIFEFTPPFSLYMKKVTPFNYSYLAFLLFSLVGLRYLRKIGVVHLLLLAVFTFMSFVAIRYQIFYMCVGAPIIARVIISIKNEKAVTKLFAWLHPREGFLSIIVCIIGILLVFQQIPAFARDDFRAETFYSLPKDAADFLEEVDIKGNMFNAYAFGGYLVWRLFPAKKVFIDGRQLEDNIYLEYQIVAYAMEHPVVSWEDLIEKYNITYIIMPPLLHHGTIYPLVEKLLTREDWALIYNDHLSLIFLRNTLDNASLINTFAIDKNKGIQTIVVQASARALKNQVNPYFPFTLGKIFFQTGRLDDAEKAFRMALDRDQDNVMIQEWLQKVEDTRKNGVTVNQ